MSTKLSELWRGAGAGGLVSMLVALWAPPLIAQASGQPPPAEPTVAAPTAPRLIAEVPFEFYANKIFLNVMINGQGPYPLAFDTGSPTPVLDSDLARELDMKPGLPMPIGGAGEGSMRGSILSDVKMTIGEGDARLNLSSPATAVIPIDSRLSPSTGHRLIGLVGNNICNRYTVAVNYAAHLMRFYDAATYEYIPTDPAAPGHELKVRVRGHTLLSAFVTPEAWGDKEPIKGTFILDTGARISVALTTPFVDSHGLLNDQTPSVLAMCGHGIGGPIRHYAARLSRLSLAGFDLPNPVVNLSQDKAGVLASEDIAGIIGADILRKFTLILDYKRHRVILEPNGDLDTPIEFDMSGLWLEAEGVSKPGQPVVIKVEDVTPGSPAAAVGIRPGDTILSVDGQPAGAGPVSYEKIVELFKQDGRSVKLRLKSGESEREVELVLKRRV